MSVLTVGCVAVLTGCGSTSEAQGEAESSDVVVTTDGPRVAATSPAPIAKGWFETVGDNTGGAQMTYLRLSDGWHVGTANERLPRPALSLAKLFIADYVFQHGNDEEIAAAVEMIETSNDDIADELYVTFPKAIDATAKRYQLQSTKGDSRWGYSLTSTYDVVRFIAIKLQDDPASPIIDAMRHSAPYAADGYRQNFGTANVAGVIGTKWGWSNDRDYHASVSFGEDFVVAASQPGGPADLTKLVTTQIQRIDEMEPR
ncbi:hypothetical protein ACFPVT_01075 [Corynebacterium choanae]|nr:hypothetical protein [Corynebacterium choanae]